MKAWKTDILCFMENKIVSERIQNLRGKRSYEEKKAAKLGFPSLYAYFEDKIANESQADKIKKNKSFGKNKSVKKTNRLAQPACSCCAE